MCVNESVVGNYCFCFVLFFVFFCFFAKTEMTAQQSTEKNVCVSGDKHEDVMQNVRFVLEIYRWQL